jgi:hypothetical protein
VSGGTLRVLPAHVLSFYRPGSAFAALSAVTNKSVPVRGTSYAGVFVESAMRDSVSCPSGNVVGRSVRVPETIGSHRLAPAIQKMFAFQAKLVDMVGNGGNHIPDFSCF